MPSTCCDIGNLVLQFQEEFLVFPHLSLTTRQASQHFGLDVGTCGAVLTALAEAGVLVRSKDGVYARSVPVRLRLDARQVA